MKQSSLDLNLSTKRTRKQQLLDQMEFVVPWAALVELIAPYYPKGKNGRPPFALESMLRIHCMQQWFTLSDLAMQEAFLRYRGLKKNTLQLKTLFALSSLWMVRRQLLAAQGCVRLKTGKGPRRRQERPRGNPKARPTCRKKGRPLRHLKTAAL